MKKLFLLLLMFVAFFGAKAQSNCQARFSYQADPSGLVYFWAENIGDTSAITACSWNLGIDQYGPDVNGAADFQYQYPMTGIFYVCLHITTESGCVSAFCDTINVPCHMYTTGVVSYATSSNASDGSIGLTTFGGTAPYTALWSNGVSGYSANNLSTGFYNVTVIDSHNCQNELNFYMSDTFSLAHSCQADFSYTFNGSADATFTGFDSLNVYLQYPTVFSWAMGVDSIGGPVISNNQSISYHFPHPGPYNVCLTSQNSFGCTSTKCYTVNVDCNFSVYDSIIIASSANATDGSIHLSPDGGISQYTYLWSTGETTANLDGIATGNYSVTVTNSLNCTNIQNIYVGYYQPIPMYIYVYPNNASSGCNGSASIYVSGGTPPYIMNIGNTVYQYNQFIDSLCPGTYAVVITDASGQIATSTFTISGICNNTISGTVINASTPTSSNGSINVIVTGGTPPYMYQWSNAANTDVNANLPVGYYSLTVIDNLNCYVAANYVVSDSVSLHNNCQASFSYYQGYNSNAMSFYGHDSIYSNSQYATSWLWALGADTTTGAPFITTQNTNFTYPHPGTYHVCLTTNNSFGCTSTLCQDIVVNCNLNVFDSIFVASSPSTADGSAYIMVYGGTDPFAYVWSNGNTTNWAQNLTSGYYDVTITDATGCVNIHTVYVGYNQSNVLQASVTNITNVYAGCDGSATIIVSGGTAPFQMNTGSGYVPYNSNITNLCTGTYTVTITDALSQSSIASFTITQGQPFAQCIDADPFCTGVTVNYPAGVNSGSGEVGPNYGCLYSTPNPKWYFGRVLQSGNIVVNMHSLPQNDIDFACWGPFTTLNAGCNGQLTASCTQCVNNTTDPNFYPQGNLTDCSYSTSWDETVHINNAQVGQYYIFIITNYSNQACNIIFSQQNTGQAGAGSLDCSVYISSPASTINACIGSTLTLSSDTTIAGATYIWNGPNGFTSNIQNPVLTNISLANSGAYILNIVSGGLTITDTTYVVVAALPSLTVNALLNNNLLDNQAVNVVLYNEQYQLYANAQYVGNQFKFSNLPPINYRLRGLVQNPSLYPGMMDTYYSNTVYYTQASLLSLNCGDDTLINLNMVQYTNQTGAPFAHITGNVYIDANPSPAILAIGGTVQNADLYLKTMSDSTIISVAVTDVNGAFHFTNVPTGNYWIYVDFPGTPLVTTYSNIMVDNAHTYYGGLIYYVDTTTGTKTFHGIFRDPAPLVTESKITTMANSSINVFPNPVRNKLNIEIEAPKESTLNIELFDITGRAIRMLENANVKGGKQMFSLDLENSEFAEGVYFLHVKLDDQVCVKKIVYQK